jgi:hypothetical protein
MKGISLGYTTRIVRMQVVSAIVQFPKPVAGVYTLMLGNRVAGFKLQITSYGADGKTNGHYFTSPETASFRRHFINSNCHWHPARIFVWKLLRK